MEPTNDEKIAAYYAWQKKKRDEQAQRNQEIEELRPAALSVLKDALENPEDELVTPEAMAAAVFVVDHTRYIEQGDYDGPRPDWGDNVAVVEDPPMKVVIVGDEREDAEGD